MKAKILIICILLSTSQTFALEKCKDNSLTWDNCFGIHTYENGDVYEGEWKDNNRHGFGKYTFIYGDIYEGEWRNNKNDGVGKYTWANGDVYEGEWKDNLRTGQER